MPYYFKQIPSEFIAQKPFPMYKSWVFSQLDMRKNIKIHDADHTILTQSVLPYVIPPTQWIKDADGRILSYNYTLLNGDKYFPVSESRNYNYYVSGTVVSTNQFSGYLDESQVKMIQEPDRIKVSFNGITTVYSQSQNIFITGSTVKKNVWYTLWNLFYRDYTNTGSAFTITPEGFEMKFSGSAPPIYSDFQTGSLSSKALVFDIPKRYFGESIKKNSFSLSGTTVLAPPRLWTPEILGNRVKIWLRADRIVTSSGAPVPFWTSSSPYNNNGTLTPGYEAPLYISNPYAYPVGNERPGLSFSESIGASKGIRIPDDPSWKVTTASLFVAMYPYAFVPDGNILGNRFNGADLSYGGFHTFMQAAAITTVLNGVWSSPPMGITAGRLNILYRASKRTHGGAWNDKTSAPLSITIPDATITYSHTGSVVGYDFLVGVKSNTYGYGGWHSSLNAAVNEIIYVGDELTTDEFQKVQGYLAWKWGDSTYRTTVGLDPSHPYYNSPPLYTDAEYNQIKDPLSTINIYDDSNGNLFDSDNANILTQSYGTSSIKLPLGNISYDKGLIVITDETYRNVTSGSIGDSAAVVTFRRSTIPSYNSAGINLRFAFTSSYIAYENEYICIAKANEFNWTDNATAYTSDGNWKFKNISGSYGEFTFRPYVTGIGLYDDTNTLLAFGKINMPVRMEKDSDTIFIMNFDT